MRVFRRGDVASVRITLERDGVPINPHCPCRSLFFYDLDIVAPVVEIFGSEIALATAQEVLFRFGRAYPPYWDEDGRGGHCPWRVEWLSAAGEVLASSDYERRTKYLAFVCKHRAQAIAAHWEWLPADGAASFGRPVCSATGNSSITGCRRWRIWPLTISRRAYAGGLGPARVGDGVRRSRGVCHTPIGTSSTLNRDIVSTATFSPGAASAG
jgi:hypothetical protein